MNNNNKKYILDEQWMDFIYIFFEQDKYLIKQILDEIEPYAVYDDLTQSILNYII